MDIFTVHERPTVARTCFRKRVRLSRAVAFSFRVAEPGKDLAPAPAPRRLKPCRWLLALFSLMIGGCVEREVDFAYYKDDMDIFNYMDEKEENLRRLEHVCQGGWEPSVVLARFALSVEERHHWRNFDMGKAPCGVRNLGELMDGGVKFDNRSMAEVKDWNLDLCDCPCLMTEDWDLVWREVGD